MLEAVLPLLRFGQKAEDVEVRVEHLVKRGNLEMSIVATDNLPQGQEEARDGNDGDQQTMQVDEGAGTTKKTKRILKYAD